MKLALVTLAALAMCLAPIGCTSNQYAVQKQAAGTMVITVDAAMKVWAGWVNAGYATSQQVATVKTCYTRYSAACWYAADVYRMVAAGQTDSNNIAAAVSAVTLESGNLVNLVATFLPPDKAAQLLKKEN